MNLRSSIGLVGMFLALFWVFGLMLSLDRARVDEAYVMPTLKSKNTDFDIESVVVERKGKSGEDFHFSRKDDAWTLVQGKQAIKVEAFRIRDLIKEVREAKRDADVRLGGSMASYGLEPPQAVISLVGRPRMKIDKAALDKAAIDKAEAGEQREWKLLLGNESADKKYVYAATSDRPGMVFALPRASVNALYFKNANDLRSKRLFDFSEPAVLSFSIKQGPAEIDLKKLDAGGWMFTKPNLSYADIDGGLPAKAKETPPGKSLDGKVTEGGVKGLLTAINAVRVDADDDFVAPTPDALERNELVPGKETLRVQVLSGDAKKPTEETLIVGRRDKDYFYARLAADEGVFKLPAKSLEPLFEAVKSPEKFRNVDLSPIPIKDADAIVLSQGKEEARFTMSGSEGKGFDPKTFEPRPATKTWSIELNNSAPAPADRKVEKLLDALEGRRDIIAYKDVPDADAAKVDAELGLAQPQAAAAIYLQGVGKDGKLKSDARPAIAWAFGKAENDRVWVKRTIGDSAKAYFTVDKSVLEKLVPREGLLAYVEPVMPKLSELDVVRIAIDRGDKSVVVDKRGNRWFLKDERGELPADAKRVAEVTDAFSNLQVRRWVKTLAAAEDIEPYGLKSPPLTLTLTLKKDQLSAPAIVSVLGQLGGPMTNPSLPALGAIFGNLHLGGEKVVFKFGKGAPDKADAGSVFVQNSRTDRLGLVADPFTKLLKNIEFRDPSYVLGPANSIAALTVGAPATPPINGLFGASPLATAQFGRGEAADVKELRVTIRTPVEVRSFAFSRKDKSWVDLSGLKEFQIDDDHVNVLAELVARLDMNRVIQLTGGAKADQKLTPQDATITIDAQLNDQRIVNLTIGANFKGIGYYTQVSTWPGAVFFLNTDRVAPLLGGAAFFAKEGVAAN